MLPSSLLLSASEPFSIMIIAIILAVIVFFIILPFVFIAEAAENHGRSGIGWAFLSIMISPLFALLLLIALGDTKERRLEKWREYELFRQSLNQDNRTLKEKSDENERLKRLLEQSRRS